MRESAKSGLTVFFVVLGSSLLVVLLILAEVKR
jgi:hypothetical protein